MSAPPRPTRAILAIVATASALLVAARDAAPRLARTGQSSIGRREDRFSFLDNGIVKLGVDLSRGGSIGWFGPSQSSVNHVNTHDFGREVQGSFYAGPAPFNPPGCNQPPAYAGFPWNPIGAGDYYSHPAQLLSVAVAPDNTSALVVTRPAQWACNATPCECTFTQAIRLVGNAVEITLTLNNSRSDRTAYGAFGQELPAVYLNGPLCSLYAYTGDNAFAGEPPTRFVAPPPTAALRLLVPERWAAFVGDDGRGVGLWHPDVSTFAAMRWNGSNATLARCDGGAGTGDDVTGYVSPQTSELLDADIAYAYTFALVLGTVADVRAYATAQHAAGRMRAPGDYVFTTDRQHWTATNAVFGAPPTAASPGLRVTLPSDDPQLVGPLEVWLAGAAPTIYVTATYPPPQHDETAQLFWLRRDAAGFSAADSVSFPIVADGAPHSYAVNLAAAPPPANYTGVIVELRFDPVGAGAPGATVVVHSVSWRRTDSVRAGGSASVGQ